MCIWQWYRCPDPEMMDITYWMVVYKFGERPVWLNLCDVWGWVYAVNGMALLWCNFRSCSWQLWVESKLKASWFRCLGGEDQQSTWNWDSLMATWDCPKQVSDVFHLTLSQLRPLLYCLDREADFWLLGYFNIFWFIWIITLLRLTLMSCSNFFCLSQYILLSKGYESDVWGLRVHRIAGM